MTRTQYKTLTHMYYMNVIPVWKTVLAKR